MKNIIELCEYVIDTALIAGHKIMEFYDGLDTSTDIKKKADHTPVTIADIASHDVILQKLSSVAINEDGHIAPVLSEESKNISTTARHQWQDYWLVDPLDGTKEYIDKNDEFCINIALIRNNRPVIGVVYAPALDLIYYAMRGYGAYKIEGFSQQKNISSILDAKKIQSKKISGDKLADIDLNITTSRRHNKSSRYSDFINNLNKHKINYNLLTTGSALKLCYVAEGKADLYPRFGLTGEWDTAAGECILEEAGGELKTFNNKQFLYNKRDILINSDFYAVGDGGFNWQEFFGLCKQKNNY